MRPSGSSLPIERSICIAGVGFRFRSSHPGAGRALDLRYAAFSCEADQSATFTDLELTFHDGPPQQLGAAYDISRAPSGKLRLTGAGSHAEFFDADRCVHLDSPLASTAVDALVRLLLCQQLIARGGLLVHASAVERNGLAFVFAGDSGAGKTTIASRLPGIALCDEAVALVPAAQGLRAMATPYWHGSPRSAPVGALVFIGRTDRASAEPLSPAQAAAALFALSGPLTQGLEPAALACAATIASASPRLIRAHLAELSDITQWLPARLDGRS